MGLTNFQPDDAGLQEILNSPEVGALLLGIINEGKAFAEAASADFAVSGHYAASFETALAIETHGTEKPHTAQTATLRNTADYAVQVEYGIGGSHDAETGSAHNVLRRTRSALHA